MKNCGKLWQILAIGAISACLMACSTRSDIKERYVEVPTPVFPPEELLRECKVKPPVIETTGDLVEAYSKVWGAIERCDADKEALRKWKSGYSKIQQ